MPTEQPSSGTLLCRSVSMVTRSFSPTMPSRLRRSLHQAFAAKRVNRINLRREFFYATPEEVLEVLVECARTHQRRLGFVRRRGRRDIARHGAQTGHRTHRGVATESRTRSGIVALVNPAGAGRCGRRRLARQGRGLAVRRPPPPRAMGDRSRRSRGDRGTHAGGSVRATSRYADFDGSAVAQVSPHVVVATPPRRAHNENRLRGYLAHDLAARTGREAG